MGKMVVFMAALALALSLVPTTQADTIINFNATLLGTNEVPPNASPATGSISLTLHTATDLLDVSEIFSGLTAPAAAAHIHCCASPGSNAAVVLNFTGAGFPVGVTSGTYAHTFDLNTDLLGITLPNFLNGLETGQAYANIHDANFPGGEIRGQLAQVPEPATLTLMGVGLSGLWLSRRRRRC